MLLYNSLNRAGLAPVPPIIGVPCTPSRPGDGALAGCELKPADPISMLTTPFGDDAVAAADGDDGALDRCLRSDPTNSAAALSLFGVEGPELAAAPASFKPPPPAILDCDRAAAAADDEELEGDADCAPRALVLGAYETVTTVPHPMFAEVVAGR